MRAVSGEHGILDEKDGSGRSATRTIAIAFSVAGLFRLFYMTILGQALGWPDAFFFTACLLAVPLAKLFSGVHGASLAGKLLDRLGVGAAGANAATATVTGVLDRMRGLDNRRTDDERGDP